jgi:hypothetical protein
MSTARPSSSDAYRLGYRWTIEGPIHTVFHFVSDARTFKDWFFVFKDVQPDDPTGTLQVGSHVRCLVKAALPYALDWDITVAEMDIPNFIQTDCRVTLGGRFPLNGYVRYRFQQNGPLVTVINEQELSAERPLPQLLRPLAQRLFAFNHDRAMGQAEAPLQRVVRAAVERGRSGLTSEPYRTGTPEG